MSLAIKKYGNKNFQHESEDYQDYGANDITIIFEGNTVRLRSLSGRVIFDRVGYPLNEVSVYDVGGSAETFPSIEALKQRLINLGYPFNGGSEEVVLNSVDWGNINGDINNQVDLINELDDKQDTLVSGANIKTINGNSLLGGGNLEVESIPTGGNTGQVLTKQSSTDYDADWEDVPPTTLQESIAADDTATSEPKFEGGIKVGNNTVGVIRFDDLMQNLLVFSNGFSWVSADDFSYNGVDNDSISFSKIMSNLVQFKKDWDASTNTPPLSNAVTNKADIYRVSVAGSHDFGVGSIDFEVDDYVINDGTIWRKFINNSQSGTYEVSIEDFGAVADNSTNSTQAFLDARDDLISKGGGKLIIPNRGNNRFHISTGSTNGLADYSNITITGGGKVFIDETALGGGNSRAVFVKLADGTDNFKMCDLDFLVSADAVTENNYVNGVICSEQVDDCTITNVWIEKVKIHSESRLDSEIGNHGITFTRNSPTNQGTLDNITIRDCDINLYGNSIYGIHLQMNGIYTTIEDNKVFLEASTSAPNEAYNAIAVYADREYTYISGNHAQGGHSSYAVSTSGKATIIGNWAYNCTVIGEAGFEFEYKGGHGTVGYQPEDVIISGNHSIGNYIGYLITDRINDATSKSPRNVILTNNIAKYSILSDAEITSSFGAGGDDTTRISNVILDGNFFLSSASEANIRSRDGSNLKIINNTCDGGSRAIKLGRNSNVKVRGEIDLTNNTLKNFNIGIEIETADNIDLSVNNNKAYGGTRAFTSTTNINAGGETTMSFIGNMFKDQTGDALHIANSNVEGILINANTFIGAGDRGAQVTADNVIYTSNVSRGCTNNPQISGTGNVNQNNINI